MSIDAFMRNLERYKLVAHRLGYMMEGYPENSMDNLKSLFYSQERLAGIQGIEFDIHFSADNVPFVIHDFNVSDISKEKYAIKKTLSEVLTSVKCGYRRSSYNDDVPWDENNNFNLMTLEELLSFLADNRDKLSDKVIKIETKSPFLRREDIISLKNVLGKHNVLSENFLHISFFPWNLSKLRSLEQEKSLPLTKTEVLIDFSFEKPLEKIWGSSIDGVSLGLKNMPITGTLKLDRKSKRTANANAFFYTRRNALSEEWLNDSINTYGYAGIYTVNDRGVVEELLSRVSPEFLDGNADKLYITSDNPASLRKIR